MKFHLTLALALPLLAGCDRLGEQLGLPDPKREAAHAEAEGKAVGGACRHSGRALEDCFIINPGADKAAVFAGWKEMNDYMMQNNIAEVKANLPTPNVLMPRPRADEAHAPASTEPAKPAPTEAEATTTPRRRLRAAEAAREH